jgi:hypothetical protein
MNHTSAFIYCTVFSFGVAENTAPGLKTTLKEFREKKSVNAYYQGYCQHYIKQNPVKIQFVDNSGQKYHDIGQIYRRYDSCVKNSGHNQKKRMKYN